METKQHATKNQGSMMKSKSKSENTSKQIKVENNFPKFWGYSKSSSKKEIHSKTGLPREIRKISNKQPNLPCKRIRKRRTNKAQSQQKEGNNDITYTWNLKNNTNESMYKTETDRKIGSRWWSRRTCAHSLLQEHRNHN